MYARVQTKLLVFGIYVCEHVMLNNVKQNKTQTNNNVLVEPWRTYVANRVGASIVAAQGMRERS